MQARSTAALGVHKGREKPPQKTSIAPWGYDSVTAPNRRFGGGLESAFGV
jgi:hypothetical protein